ncbi:MAG: HAD family phosphatase [Bacteroidetes bacterium]|nr:HAD family phosphatase [Bacteroidota bacterium]
MNNLKQFDTIIFDLGGVLIDIDYQATTNSFRKLGVMDFELHYNQLQQESLFDSFEKGEISGQHFINKLMNIVPKGITPNQIVTAWNAMLGSFPLKKIELLERVSETHKTFLLSNTNEIHMPIVQRNWNNVSNLTFSELFEKVYLSFEIGKRKPDVETFQWVIEENNLNPEKTIFIDDSPQHIIGAEKAGLKTHFYQSEEEFYVLFS